MINDNLCYEILDTLLSYGADFAEIFVENNLKNSISMTNGEVENAISGVDFGVGLRIFVKDKIIYSYTNDIERENILKIAKETALALKGESSKKIPDFIKFDYTKENIHQVKIMPESVNKKQIVNMLKSASDTAFSYNNLITQTSVGYMDSVQDILIVNSQGNYVTDRRVRTRASVNAVASNEIEKQVGYFGPGALMGYEFYDTINLNSLAKQAAESAVIMLNAKECPSGKMPVILDNGFGGVIFHEACGHGLEAAAIAKKASVFLNKIGQKIANEKVTAIDDGTIKNSWGSINVDDEGIKTRKNILIENGILKSYLVDKYNGQKLGMDSTGSSRRQSYKFAPVSRMTNTFIAAGTDSKDDIISNTEYGLYAKYMGGGSVNPASGEFNFSVREAYIIRNGKIAEPVRGATLIGKGTEVLMDIDMVSDNLELSEGMCGASSGSVPVDVGQPMIRVKQMIVGGRG